MGKTLKNERVKIGKGNVVIRLKGANEQKNISLSARNGGGGVEKTLLVPALSPFVLKMPSMKNSKEERSPFFPSKMWRN